LLVTPPARGKIKLREGGYYIYTAPSSQGSDKFTLRVCGSQNNSPGCATLNYSVTVRGFPKPVSESYVAPSSRKILSRFSPRSLCFTTDFLISAPTISRPKAD